MLLASAVREVHRTLIAVDRTLADSTKAKIHNTTAYRNGAAVSVTALTEDHHTAELAMSGDRTSAQTHVFGRIVCALVEGNHASATVKREGRGYEKRSVPRPLAGLVAVYALRRADREVRAGFR